MLILSICVCALLLAGCWVPYNPNRANFFSAIAGAVIGAGAKIIAGNKDRKEQRKINAANSPVGQVAQWEAAGINPAFGISQGQYIPQVAASVGDSWATAGALFGDAANRMHDEKLKETAIRKENTKLRETLDELTKKSEKSEFQRNVSSLPLAGIAASASSASTHFSDVYRADPGGRTTMRRIDGQPVSVRNDVLLRLDLEPGGLFGIAEDGEALWGEIGGEFTGIGAIGDDFANKDNPLVKRINSEDEKKQARPRSRPLNVGGAFHQNADDFRNIIKNRF